MTTEQNTEGMEWKPRWATPLKAAVAVIVAAFVIGASWLVTSLSVASEEHRQAIEELRGEFEEYKATKEAEIDSLEEALHAKFVTETLVRHCLPNLIARYEHEFHRLPPMTTKDLNLLSRFEDLELDYNSCNECAEALWVALGNAEFSTPLTARDLPTEVAFGNTDEDIWNRLPHGNPKDPKTWNPEAFEILDAWGHPVAYIHRDRYNERVEIINGKGDAVEVVALKRPNGGFYNPTSYQLLSIGPNGVQETTNLEDSDDVRNFELSSK